MRSFIVAASLLAASVFAAPEASLGKRLATRGAKCMSSSDAQQVATNFKNLIADYSDELADSSLTKNFHDYSDSVNELINSGCSGPQALGSATFTSLAAFKAGQSQQPAIPFEQLNIWNNCDTVVIRWRSAQSPEIVTGNIVMETVYHGGSWKIETVYSEFNSGAWLVNLNVFTPTCSSSRRLLRA